MAAWNLFGGPPSKGKRRKQEEIYKGRRKALFEPLEPRILLSADQIPITDSNQAEEPKPEKLVVNQDLSSQNNQQDPVTDLIESVTPKVDSSDSEETEDSEPVEDIHAGDIRDKEITLYWTAPKVKQRENIYIMR